MSFAALPTAWAWLLVAAAAAAAAAVFLIRPRPPRRTLSSLLMWDRVLRARPDEARRQWIRRAVSLVLTVVIAVAIAMAFGQPAPRGHAGVARRLLVIDSSWSMTARTAAGATRWQRAIASAEALANASAGPIAVATTADGLVQGLTTDAAVIAGALARLAPAGGTRPVVPRLPDVDEVHVFTDGASPLRLMPSDIVHSVFARAPNAAITAFDVRAAADGDTAEVYLEIANFADAQPVQMTLARGSDVVLSRSLQLGAGEAWRQVVPMPIAGDPRLHLKIAAPADDMEIDNEAAAWMWQAAPLVVGLVGTDPVLGALLARDPSIKVQRVAPDAYAKTRADVWIFDRWLPPAQPDVPALLIDPPAASWIGRPGPDENGPAWPDDEAGGLLRGVEAALIRVNRAHAYQGGPLEAVAQSARGTPLVSQADRDGRRFVVWHFAIGDTDLPQTAAFPVLIGNTIDWLGRPWAGLRRGLGPAVLPSGTTRLVGPDGRDVILQRRDDRVTAELRRPGLYLASGSGAQNVLTVALENPTLSDLRQSHLTATDVERPGGNTAHAWWVILAAVAAALALTEWFTWQRRVTV